MKEVHIVRTPIDGISSQHEDDVGWQSPLDDGVALRSVVGDDHIQDNTDLIRISRDKGGPVYRLGCLSRRKRSMCGSDGRVEEAQLTWRVRL